MNKEKLLIFGLCGESVFMKVDHFHEEGETITAHTLYKEPGGKGYNQAVACQKLGIETCFVGCVGDDEFGRLSINYLTKVGVNSKIIVKEKQSSAYATILTDKLGNNKVTVYPGASSLIKVEDINNVEYLFKKYHNVLLQLELSEEIIKRILELCEKYKCRVFLNPAPYKNFIHNMINKQWILTPNYSEAMSLFNGSINDSYEELARKIIDSGYENVVITLGKDGAMIIENNSIEIIPSIVIDQSLVVDTTGAGDVFNAGLVCSLLKGNTLKEATIFGIKASCYSIQKPYVMPSIPSLCDVLKDPIYQEDKYFPYQEKNNTRHTVRVFAQNEDGLFGMIRIKGTDEFGKRNHLESAGGGIELGECKLDAVMREVKEEMGYDCKIVSKICTIIHEFNLINRITYANYYYVLVDTSKCNTSYTESEKELFVGVEWYTLDDLVKELKKSNNNVGKLVHERELLAINELKEYLNRESNE